MPSFHHFLRGKVYTLQTMFRLFVLACLAVPTFAQPQAAPRVFKATAQLGVPVVIGFEYTVSGSGEKLQMGGEREVTLSSAELAMVFPNRQENVIASAGEKLLIMRGSYRNPEKTSVAAVSSSEGVGLRLWQAYKGKGKFKHVGNFDPDTQQFIRKQLKGGESTKFISVWKIPAEYTDFRFGLMYDRPQKVAWYDLGQAMGRIRSAFATSDGLCTNDSAKVEAGETFDLGALEIRMGGVSSDSGPRYIVNLTVTNRLLFPARWGWQYLAAELITADGSVIKAFPDIIDQATGRSWYGDLNAGASMTARFLFGSDSTRVPRALRLTSSETGRSIEAALTR